MRVLCSSRKPMRKGPVSGFPRALLSLSHARKRRALASRLVKTLKACISAAQINAQIDLSEDLPLFRVLATPWSKEKVRSQGISYTRVRELVKDAFRGLRDVSKIGVHNLGDGGATSAANAGIPDRRLKRLGRWASENAKDGCVKEDFNSRLLVSHLKCMKFQLHHAAHNMMKNH